MRTLIALFKALFREEEGGLDHTSDRLWDRSEATGESIVTIDRKKLFNQLVRNRTNQPVRWGVWEPENQDSDGYVVDTIRQTKRRGFPHRFVTTVHKVEQCRVEGTCWVMTHDLSGQFLSLRTMISTQGITQDPFNFELSSPEDLFPVPESKKREAVGLKFEELIVSRLTEERQLLTVASPAYGLLMI